MLPTLIKVTLTVALITWLVESGKLDFKALSVFVDFPYSLLANVAYWAIGIVLLGGTRWWILLRGLGAEVRWSRALHLHLVGLFFNTCMPGAVGGDLVKALYVIRDTVTSKVSILLSILLDRILGLFGLFCIASLTLVFVPGPAGAHPKLEMASSFFVALFLVLSTRSNV